MDKRKIGNTVNNTRVMNTMTAYGKPMPNIYDLLMFEYFG